MNYVISGKRGIELLDIDGDDHSRSNWIRGTCQYGIMPANGLLYAPPHSCGCFPEVLVRGFYAMSSRRTGGKRPAEEERLERGAAFGKVGEATKPAAQSSWPTFRGNAKRSATVNTELAAQPSETWTAEVGERLSQPVVSAETLLVSSLDKHTVFAFDAETGKARWSRTVGGPVDSPPTIHEGRLCLFGSADGYVYCLRLSDGELVWRFQAAPADQRTVFWGKIESVWPVHGSVLVLSPSTDSGEAVAYVSAGRASFFDHGMELYGLNPDTGQVLHHHHYETPQPKFGAGRDAADAESLKKQYSRHGWTDYKTFYQSDKSRSFSSAAGSLSDVLVGGDADIFLRHKRFGPDLTKKDEPARHLYAISGFLNDMAGEARTAWVLSDQSLNGGTGGGSDRRGGVHNLLAYDGDSVWAGANIKTRKHLVKIAGSVLQLAPLDSNAKGVTIDLPAPAVWDGAAAADGRLYVSIKNGSVVCYE